MADLWLEKELARQLAPVAAPESLWGRIDRQPRPRHRLSLEWLFWPVAAAMVLVAVAGALRSLNADRDPARFTDQELAVLARTSGFDFRSDNFADIRAWVKARANIDIDLPPGRHPGQPPADRGAVRLLGVRMLDLRGLPIAAVDYRAGGEAATLLVSGKRAGLTSNRPYSQGRLVSWNMRDETYTIALSSVRNARGACLLCHTGTPS